MSVLESSNPADGSLAEAASGDPYAGWRGLLRLSLGMLLGPVVALVNQQLVYLADMWACGHGLQGAVHVVPVLCLIVTIGAAIVAYRDWRAVGAGVEDSEATIGSRTRFMALCGIVISVFSSLVIVGQWAAIFVFDPCMRA
ncbi:MAG TPA: hypothetical protein VHB25_09555 [Gemmatimonadaceae bacterium]|nr:hypothetical protein [Gemmatimonadaceae bacterium]